MLRLAVLLSFVSSLAQAQACEEANPELEGVDQDLWSAYQLAYRRADTEQKEQLDRAQEAWLAYRAANCALIAERSGQIASEPHATCLMSMARDRAAELRLIAQTTSACGCGQLP